MPNADRTYRLQRAGLAWLVAYLLMIALVVWLLFHVRARAMQLDTPEDRAAWEAYRQAAAGQSASGPVHRRVPLSREAPTVVLLRDHFGVMLGASVVFSSLLFATGMIVVRGAYGSKHKSPDASAATEWGDS